MTTTNVGDMVLAGEEDKDKDAAWWEEDGREGEGSGLSLLLRYGVTTLGDTAVMVLNGKGDWDGDDNGVEKVVATMLNGEGGDNDAGAMAGWATVTEEWRGRMTSRAPIGTAV